MWVVTVRVPRTNRSAETREALLAAAERLFAERGMHAVSNRQISEAAGQGNNTAALYHFGSREELLRAIEHKHRTSIEELHRRKLEEIEGSTDLRDWVGVMVRGMTDHLIELGNPSWFARFTAQAMADPASRPIIVADGLDSPQLVRVVVGLHACLPPMSKRVLFERNVMTRNLLLHSCADYETELAARGLPSRPHWDRAADGLIDAVAGIWLAPVRADTD